VKKEGIFKYYISISFRCFTQYYENTKRYYGLLYYLYKLSIFRCALYKNGGVGDLARMQEFTRGVLVPRTGLQCIIWCDWIGPVIVKIFWREISAGI
jgi:hypothetical protein